MVQNATRRAQNKTLKVGAGAYGTKRTEIMQGERP